MEYKAPLRDMRFVIHEFLEMDNHYTKLGLTDVNGELIDSLLDEGAKFCEKELAPLNRVGDQEGCHFNNGEVTTPKGFKEAYAKYIEAGWPAMNGNPAFGGQGLPGSASIPMSEMAGTANWAWQMYPGLSHGAIATIEEHGTEAQRNTYLAKLISGEWTGTMCLTEPACGSDLGILKSRAEPNADGSYSITGTKIFISAGEHDMAENIIHIVLARLPGAPAGTKGISLFIVPKFNINADDSIGTRNAVTCGSIEHKMGIKGSATCVMNFDGAKGFLIGPENKGLNCMFTFMNFARIGTAIQGVAHAEAGFQGGLAYAKERLAMRSLSGPKNPNGPADPIIVHPDVRRMLLTAKAFAEGGRMLVYQTAQLGDLVKLGDEETAKNAEQLMAFLTPIAKAFLTEVGFEAANHGVQIFGGHGFICENGMEQNVRDSRISMLYEGTTGIQALDLLGRKVLQTQGASLRAFTKIIHKFCEAHALNAELKPMIDQLSALNKEWGDITMAIGAKAMQNPENVGAASVDYLMYSGYVTLAYLWARAASIAQQKLADGTTTEEAFYKAKIKTAEFYFKRILPRTAGHKGGIEGGLECLMALSADDFAF